MNNSIYSTNKRAFTLIELLVVIAIIALLAAILFPVFAQAKEAAKKSTCLSNMKQLSMANLLYVQDFDDVAPTYTTGLDTPTVYESNEAISTTVYNPAAGWTITNIKGGLLNAYVKAVELTGCPTGRDLVYTSDTSSAFTAVTGLYSIGYNYNMLEANMSDAESPAQTGLVTDAGQYRTVLSGVPTDGIYSNHEFWNGLSRCMIHGRHGGKVNVGWLDGHAKSMAITERDMEPHPSYFAQGITKAKYNKNHIGWLMPAGLVPNNSWGAPYLNTVIGDPHSDNLINLKKIP